MKKIAALVLLTALAISACKDVDAPELNDPVITVTKPTENEIIQQGDTVFLKVNFYDDTKVDHYQVDITGNGNNYMHFTVAGVNQQSFDLDTFKIMTDTGHFQITLFTDDVNDNFVNKNVQFVVQ